MGFLVVAVLTFLGLQRMNRRQARRPAVRLDLDPRDTAELDAVAQRLLWERLAERSTVLAGRLRTILNRGVPPRGLTPGGEGAPWTLTFADGTIVRVTARRQADLMDLLLSLMRGRATLLGHVFEGDDVVLEFAAGERLVRLTAVGVA